ncbi:plasmid replication initiator RepA [Klebsiella oxytoca]|uniref:plasmid replication initiator RepA n=1 Tax=Klebsiella oxytoca TaxID=571 RepID=UPI00254FAD6D|nr:plasmid replication initiator RepA [Klebsiella oxytoca]MEC5509942.1 plasmid replication initiator RepA [Klebsiella oxytoca]
MSEQSRYYYKQVKNPFPAFTLPEDTGTIPFCLKLMEKAKDFTSRFDFLLHVAFSRSIGRRKRKPPVLRCRAIDALLQGMCFHYDPLAGERGRVQCSITTLAIECGLATESEKGNLAITKATRALKSLDKDFGLITYKTEFDPAIGCNVPSDIEFTPALFDALGVSETAVAAARRSCYEKENKKRKQKGLPRLEFEELASNAFKFVRERFREYHRKHRENGIKRRRAKRDAERSRKDIENIVKRELTREISLKRFPADKAAVFEEIQRRVKERMILSRGHHTRLATPIPI